MRSILFDLCFRFAGVREPATLEYELTWIGRSLLWLRCKTLMDWIFTCPI